MEKSGVDDLEECTEGGLTEEAEEEEEDEDLMADDSMTLAVPGAPAGEAEAAGMEETSFGGVAGAASEERAGEERREGVVGVPRMGVAPSTGGGVAAPEEDAEAEVTGAETTVVMMAATSEGRRGTVGRVTLDLIAAGWGGGVVSGTRWGGGGVSREADLDGGAPPPPPVQVEERSSASECKSSNTGSSITAGKEDGKCHCPLQRGVANLAILTFFPLLPSHSVLVLGGRPDDGGGGGDRRRIHLVLRLVARRGGHLHLHLLLLHLHLRGPPGPLPLRLLPPGGPLGGPLRRDPLPGRLLGHQRLVVRVGAAFLRHLGPGPCPEEQEKGVC